MKENFESVKAQVDIKDIATYLLGKPFQGMYRFPGERTASIKIYSDTQSFYDFGRGIGGDSIRLWSHIKGCDNWSAMNEISSLYGISTDLNETDRKSITEQIKAQETAQKERRIEEKRKRKHWIKEIERLQEWKKLCQNLLDSGHLPPFCDVRGWCYSEIQIADHKLDVLCGIE
mgnify:CR=1 FL=1